MKTWITFLRHVFVLCLTATSLIAAVQGIDWNRARDLHQRSQRGETLSEEENAYLERALIRDQMAGNPQLNFDRDRGAVKSPLILWGPYLWADGLTPRESDGLVWKREDLAGGGTHPSSSGRRKVAELLLKFFRTEPTAKPWFLRAVRSGNE